MKYDIETSEADLLRLIKSKLPGKLTEISTEKADGIILTAPVDKDYFNTTDDVVNNRKLSFQYGVIDGDVVSIGSSTSEENRYLFLIYLDEQNKNSGVVRKMLLRYIRALKEVIEENFKYFIPCGSDLKIQTVAPTSASWSENERSPVYKVGGIYVNISIVS